MDDERLQAQLIARDKDFILSKERMLEESHKKVQQLLKDLQEAKRQISNRRFDELISDAKLMAEKNEKASLQERFKMQDDEIRNHRQTMAHRP